jgi:hypothetical protein
MPRLEAVGESLRVWLGRLEHLDITSLESFAESVSTQCKSLRSLSHRRMREFKGIIRSFPLDLGDSGFQLGSIDSFVGSGRVNVTNPTYYSTGRWGALQLDLTKANYPKVDHFRVGWTGNYGVKVGGTQYDREWTGDLARWNWKAQEGIVSVELGSGDSSPMDMAFLHLDAGTGSVNRSSPDVQLSCRGL